MTTLLDNIGENFDEDPIVLTEENVSSVILDFSNSLDSRMKAFSIYHNKKKEDDIRNYSSSAFFVYLPGPCARTPLETNDGSGRKKDFE